MKHHGPIWCRLFHRPIEEEIEIDDQPHYTFGCGPLYDIDTTYTCRFGYSWMGLW